jgi:hypothetical protein
MKNNTHYLKHIPQAQQFGSAVARDLFVCMLNPEFRGENFTWDKFREMAVRRAGSSLFTAFPDSVWKKHGKELTEIAQSSAKLAAEQCLKDSGVEKWLPLPVVS